MLSDSNAPGGQHGDEMQLSPSSPKRSREDGPDYRGAHVMPSSHNEYDERDKGEYEPASKRAKISKQDDDHADFYDDRPIPSKHQRHRESSRSRSRSQSRERGRDESYRRSRSPAHSPKHHARSTHRNRSRSPVRRHDREPRGRRGSNARDERGPERHRWGDRPGGRNGAYDHGRGSSPPYANRRHSGAGGRNIPEPTQRDAVRAKQDVTQEDRKRGQRLFGGLLTNLRGPATGPRPAVGRGPPGQRTERASGAFKGRLGGRPAAAEATHEKSTSSDLQRPQLNDRSKSDTADQMQTDEDDKKAAERLAKLDRVRKIEQVRFDEQKMHTLQANDLALACCLETQSKPRVFYHPRDLSGKQKEIIEGQVRDAEQRASEKRQAFEKDKAERLSALGVKYPSKGLAAAGVPSTTPEPVQQDDNPIEEAHADTAPRRDSDEMVDEPTATAAAAATESAEQVDTNAASPDRTSMHMDDGEENGLTEELHDHHDDRDKDVMVETEEDTVIY